MLPFDHRLLDLSVSVLVAFVLATAIGAERQYRRRSAGLRTNVLVAVGAATFVSIGLRPSGDAGATQLASYVVSGIGFDAAPLAKIVKRWAPASAFVEFVSAQP